MIAALLAGMAAVCAAGALALRSDGVIVARLPSAATVARSASTRRWFRSVPFVRLLAPRRSERRRRAAADREVPVLLDLLAVSTSAGLPPQLALRRAVEAVEGPLAEELGAAIRATDLGGRWRDELEAAAARLRLPDLGRAVGALTRAEALGSSLADEIGRLATDVREIRRAAATERARAAPVKMLFPLVFLVLPAFLLLTVVPVLVATVASIR
jgi:pilus assembly protein TadC